MTSNNNSNENGQNRRNFIKSQAIIGIGALAAGIPLTKASAMTDKSVPAGSTANELSLAQYQTCLGGPFPEPSSLKTIIKETIQKDGYRMESISYEVQPGERINAWLLIPDRVTAGKPAPGIAVWHQHNGQYYLGKSEPAGLAGNPMHHTAVALAREGYVVVCPDALCFGERQDVTGKLKDGQYERFEFLRQIVRGRSLAWKNILDMRRAIDLLCERQEVIKERLGCYGHSMGSTHSWLLGPLEKRLKCIVGNCCLPTYEAIEEEHLLHCFPNFIPGWLNYGDTPEIAALIAPRTLHLNLGEIDTGSPILSARRGLQRISEAYKKAGVPDNFTYYIEPGAGHVLSEKMWTHVKECFAKTLLAG